MAKTGAATAFDFNRMERNDIATPHGVRQPPELRVVESRRARDRNFMMHAAICFIMVLAIVSAILYNNVVLTELTAQIESVQDTYSLLKNENRRMQVELEGRISLRSVEDVAEQKLGMAQTESYQIEYVDLGEGNRVLLSRAHKPTVSEQLVSLFGRVKAYIGI
ncbi:MAG: hypothetical protein RR135_04165 [Oscillospiraceae bacterium]